MLIVLIVFAIILIFFMKGEKSADQIYFKPLNKYVVNQFKDDDMCGKWSIVDLWNIQ